jgi:hypothetical protein
MDAAFQHPQCGRRHWLLTLEGRFEGLIKLLRKGHYEPSILRSFFKARFLAAKIFFFRFMLGFS